MAFNDFSFLISTLNDLVREARTFEREREVVSRFFICRSLLIEGKPRREEGLDAPFALRIMERHRTSREVPG